MEHASARFCISSAESMHYICVAEVAVMTTAAGDSDDDQQTPLFPNSKVHNNELRNRKLSCGHRITCLILCIFPHCIFFVVIIGSL